MRVDEVPRVQPRVIAPPFGKARLHGRQRTRIQLLKGSLLPFNAAANASALIVRTNGRTLAGTRPHARRMLCWRLHPRIQEHGADGKQAVHASTRTSVV